MLTPKGVVSRYLYGIDYAPRDLRLGARRGARTARIGSPIDQVCCSAIHYDPATGRVRYRGDARHACASRGRGAVARRGAIAERAFGQPDGGASARRRAAERPRESNLYDVHELSVLSRSRRPTQAAQVDALYFFLVAVTAFFSLLIAALIVVFAVKYRRRAPTRSAPPSTARSRSSCSGRSSRSASRW